jgi:hypothetical protein
MATLRRPTVYIGELRDTTLTSFVKFIAQRYKAERVKTDMKAIKVPDYEKCSKCESNTRSRILVLKGQSV